MVNPLSVSPAEYDRKYFLTDCGGYRNFIDHLGLVVDRRMSGPLYIANIKPGMMVLDVGSGRGEVIFRAALKGANAIGIDYSRDAVELGNGLKKSYPVTGKRMEFIHGSATSLPFDDCTFDKVFMLDVVEHLHDYELDKLFRDLKAILKDDGMIIIHTSPNKLFYDYGYRLMRHVINCTGRAELKKNPRSDYEKKMHINEQTARSLKKYLVKAGFESIICVSETDYIEEVIRNNAGKGRLSSVLSRIATIRRLNFLFGNSIYAVAWKTGRLTPDKNVFNILERTDYKLDNGLIVRDSRDVCEDLLKDRVLMDDIGNIGTGWYSLEQWPDNSHIRWSMKEACAYLKNDGHHGTLTIKCYSPIKNTLKVFVNGMLVKIVSLNNSSWQEIQCGNVESGILEVRIGLDKTWLPDSGDNRELGVAVERIWLEYND